MIVKSLHLMEVKRSAILTAVAAVRPAIAAWEQSIPDTKSEWHQLDGGAIGLNSELFQSSAISS
jgi:hypothetical protein